MLNLCWSRNQSPGLDVVPEPGAVSATQRLLEKKSGFFDAGKTSTRRPWVEGILISVIRGIITLGLASRQGILVAISTSSGGGRIPGKRRNSLRHWRIYVSGFLEIFCDEPRVTSRLQRNYTLVPKGSLYSILLLELATTVAIV